ncbi:Meiosis-specific nuclear structural protein 1 [Dissostichus eleginoides]|uniref:Meiosis-specific nuclear structural protein 1 n=1 Tax=Dissostichus eleginoides TaxID=100907 RepID=A0AAD9BSH1_DISEL|nr:Meiosis-specific nuclear structural protein 1 [Dissostichus eleginoides]
MPFYVVDWETSPGKPPKTRAQKRREKLKQKRLEEMVQYQRELELQRMEKERKRQEAYEEFLKEKLLVDELVRKMYEEGQTERQLEKVRATQQHIEQFKKYRAECRHMEESKMAKIRDLQTCASLDATCHCRRKTFCPECRSMGTTFIKQTPT